MRKNYIAFLALAGCFLISANGLTNNNGAPAAHNGAPGSLNCTTSGCHTGPAQTSETVTISTNIPSSGFLPNTNYNITITANDGGRGLDEIGFEANVQDGSSPIGTLSTNGNKDEQLTLGQNFITHTFSGSSAAGGMRTWTFGWNSGNAPDSSKVYVAVNFSNNNNTSTGDVIVNESLLLTKAVVSNASLNETSTSRLHLFPNPANDFIHLIIDNDIRQAQLFSLKGEIIKTFIRNAPDWRINVNDLPNGVYLLKTSLGSSKVIICH